MRRLGGQARRPRRKLTLRCRLVVRPAPRIEWQCLVEGSMIASRHESQADADAWFARYYPGEPYAVIEWPRQDVREPTRQPRRRRFRGRSLAAPD